MKALPIVLTALLSGLAPPGFAGTPERLILAGFFPNAAPATASQEPPPAAATPAPEKTPDDGATATPAMPMPMPIPMPAAPPQLQNLIDEFLTTSQEVKNAPAVDVPVRFKGPAERPNWFQVLLVTSDDNPLMTEECKKQAMSFSVDRLRQVMGFDSDGAALQAAAMHMQEHRNHILSEGLSYSDYLRELAECRAFCAPLVAHLANCHVLSVARQPHGIVLFPFNSATLDARYSGDQGLIATVKRELDGRPEGKVLLIGRSSKTGGLKYNRRLAGQRALAVRDALMAAGLPQERIESMWFGWEPPQITTDVAAEYGLQTLLDSKGAAAMNQSVIMVIY